MELIFSIQDILSIIVIYAITDDVAHKTLMRTCKNLKDLVLSIIGAPDNQKYKHLQRNYRCYYKDWYADWFYALAKNGYISMLKSNKQLCIDNITMIRNRIMEGAAAGDQWTILEWAYTHKIYNNSSDDDTLMNSCIDSACKYGSFSSLMWIYNKTFFTKNIAKYKFACAFAAEGGHLDIVIFFELNGIKDEYTYDEYDYILKYAARGGNLEVIKWIIKHPYDWQLRKESKWTNEAFIMIFVEAASHDHLNVLKFLVHNKYVKKDSFKDIPDLNIVLTVTAKKGYLHILQYLKEIDYFYDWSTCYYAASGGHLNVLKWAVANECIMDPSVPMIATKSGFCEEVDVMKEKFECFKWAIENGSGWDDSNNKVLINANEIRFLTWLIENNIISEYDKCLNIKQILCEKTNKDPMYFAMTNLGADLDLLIDVVNTKFKIRW